MRYLLSLSFVVACNLVSFAQDAPKAEIFAGYSYGNYELIPATSSNVLGTSSISGASSGRLGMSGWNSSIAADMNRWFSFATDFSGYYSGSSVSTTRTQTSICGVGPTGTKSCTITIVDTVASPKIHNFLFGPQFSYPGKKIRPFGQFLVGGEHVHLTSALSVTNPGILGISPVPESGHVANTGFAMALGGGVDYTVKHRLAWRIQADYLTSQAGNLAPNHFRISTGLIWRLGN